MATSILSKSWWWCSIIGFTRTVNKSKPQLFTATKKFKIHIYYYYYFMVDIWLYASNVTSKNTFVVDLYCYWWQRACSLTIMRFAYYCNFNINSDSKMRGFNYNISLLMLLYWRVNWLCVTLWINIKYIYEYSFCIYVVNNHFNGIYVNKNVN